MQIELKYAGCVWKPNNHTLSQMSSAQIHPVKLSFV